MKTGNLGVNPRSENSQWLSGTKKKIPDSAG
jgi:hypothetical protein